MKLFVQEQKGQFIRAMAVETVYFLAVDMVHQLINLPARQFIKAAALWEDIADILMILLTGTLLPEAVRVTVIDGGAWGTITEFLHLVTG